QSLAKRPPEDDRRCWSTALTPTLLRAQVANDAGEIDAAAAALHEPFIHHGGTRAERRGGARSARRGLGEVEGLEHHGGSEAGLVGAICRRGGHRSRNRAIACQGPTLTG